MKSCKSIARAVGWLAHRLLDLQAALDGRHPLARMADRITAEVASVQAAARARQAWLVMYARLADYPFVFQPMADGAADRVEVEIEGINGLSVWSVSGDDPEEAVANAARILKRRKLERCGCDESRALQEAVDRQGRSLNALRVALKERDALLAEQCQQLREAIGKPPIFSLVEVVDLVIRKLHKRRATISWLQSDWSGDREKLELIREEVGADNIDSAVDIVRELGTADFGLAWMSWRADGARGLRLTVGQWEWERIFSREQWRDMTPDAWCADGEIVRLLCEEVGAPDLVGVLAVIRALNVTRDTTD